MNYKYIMLQQCYNQLALGVAVFSVAVFEVRGKLYARDPALTGKSQTIAALHSYLYTRCTKISNAFHRNQQNYIRLEYLTGSSCNPARSTVVYIFLGKIGRFTSH